MTPRQKELIATTFAQIAPRAERVATQFYERLFERDPSLRGLFIHADMNAQGRKLMTMLAVVLKQLDYPEQITAAARQLGARHVAYGVQPHHYATVGAALLDTLAHELGDAFSAETRTAWATVYIFLSDAMQPVYC